MNFGIQERNVSVEPIDFVRVNKPAAEIAEAFTRWESDLELIPLSRPNRSQEDLEKVEIVTVEALAHRLERNTIFLIYSGSKLVGEINYQIDPPHVFKKVKGTAWIGITLGEKEARGKGIGVQAMQFLEKQVFEAGLKRIELGVFEFNAPAIALYRKMGYVEIGRIKDFTYWNGRMWQDIRMEKFPGT